MMDCAGNGTTLICPECVGCAAAEWDGGLVLVSHDFRLIGQVAQEIWEVNKGVHKFQGDIQQFKEHLRKTHAAFANK